MDLSKDLVHQTRETHRTHPMSYIIPFEFNIERFGSRVGVYSDCVLRVCGVYLITTVVNKVSVKSQRTNNLLWWQLGFLPSLHLLNRPPCTL